jgi:hypothetical protein
VAKNVLGPRSTFTVNGVDLSQYVTNIDLNDEAEEVEVTGFSQTYREYIPGLKDSSIAVTMLQDTSGTASPDHVIGNGMYYANSSGTVKFNPDTSGTVVYTQVSKVYAWPPASGGVGDANSIDVTFRNFGTAGLTRGTA